MTNISNIQQTFKCHHKKAMICYGILLALLAVLWTISVMLAVSHNIDIHTICFASSPLALTCLYLCICFIGHIQSYSDILHITNAKHSIVHPDTFMPANSKCIAVIHDSYKKEIRMHFPKNISKENTNNVIFHILETKTNGFAWLERPNGTVVLASDVYYWQMPRAEG